MSFVPLAHPAQEDRKAKPEDPVDRVIEDILVCRDVQAVLVALVVQVRVH